MKGSSIFIKLFTAFMILTVLLIGGLWFMQTQFLEGYYYDRTIENLENNARALIEEIQPVGDISEELALYLEQQSRILGTEILLFTPEGEILYEAGPRRQMPMMGHGRRADTLTEEALEVLREEVVLSTRETRDIQRGPMGHGAMGHRDQEADILYTYVMGDGVILRLETTLNPIQEGLELTRDFYLWVLAFGGMLALALSLVFSRKIARPIEDLNQVAKEMNQMNFDVRYRGEEKGEIGELGNTLNHLTETLKKTIDQLQQELEKEKNLKNLRREFIARVSHELKTPIAIIKGYSEALEDGLYQDEEEKGKYFRILQEESMKMDQMLREILDLSRLETRHVELKEEAVEIKSYTERIMEKFKALDTDKKLRLIDDLEDAQTLIKGDPYRLEQILSNFIKNAIEHGEGFDIEIRLREETERRDTRPDLRIEIKNQGPPLSEEDREKIWESFYKREEKKGSGLGLSIAAGLLKLMNSNFGVYNENHGVVFYFSLEKLKK